MKPRRRSESRSPRPAARAAGEAPARASAPAPPAPAPPPWRDRWAWASALAVIPVVLHSLGAPLGEPVADDFDFLHRALFSGTHSLFDGGGSAAFWRPLAHQVYFQAMAGVILSHPGVIAGFHAALLALASLLVYRALRRTWPGPWSAAVASFPLLSESTRGLIAWPSQIVDLGAWVFTAIAIHEAAARRLWTTLLALLAALLCKEVAVVAALLIPWMPGAHDRRERVRWAAATGALVAAWGLAYAAVRQHAGLHIPHQAEASAQVSATPLLGRIWWAIEHCARALFSLPTGETHAAWEWPVVIAAFALFAVALAMTLRRGRRDGALRRLLPAAGWGVAWFAIAAATMTPVFPIWAPYRCAYGAVGFGVAATALCGAAHPALLAALVALRLTAFSLSPSPRREIEKRAPDTGAFIDFERLTRLQRLMRETRGALAERYPTLPRGGRVGLYHLPRHADYAYEGARSLQVWYRDSTLSWVAYSELVRHHDIPLVTIAEFEPDRHPQIALVEPDAMRNLLEAIDAVGRADWIAALAGLHRADSLQRDPNAVLFAAQLAGERGTVLAFLHQLEPAELEARRGCALWPENVYGHFALAFVAYQRRDLREAAVQVDSVLRFDPNHGPSRRLAAAIMRARGGP
jgi:hypothetical protein